MKARSTIHEPDRPARVGVRELRQNLSVFLDRVKEGETLEVTEHGRPVARLAPMPPGRASILDQLVADGRAWPAKGNLAELGPPRAIKLPPGSRSVTETVLEMREDERW